MHLYWLAWAFAFGCLTTYLYRDWTKGTTPGVMTRLIVMFTIAVIVPHVATFISHPYKGESIWPDAFVAGSLTVETLYFLGFAFTAFARSWFRPEEPGVPRYVEVSDTAEVIDLSAH